MTTYIKVMGDQDLPDSHPYKGFQMIMLSDGDRFEFDPKPYSDLHYSQLRVFRQQRGESDLEMIQCEKHTVFENAYVMNEMGKTIATFSAPHEQPQLKTQE